MAVNEVPVESTVLALAEAGWPRKANLSPEHVSLPEDMVSCCLFLTMEKEMATQSSILAWRIPWTVEPGGLQSMGSQRVGHN